jgi:hypothetical protein
MKKKKKKSNKQWNIQGTAKKSESKTPSRFIVHQANLFIVIEATQGGQHQVEYTFDSNEECVIRRNLSRNLNN